MYQTGSGLLTISTAVCLSCPSPGVTWSTQGGYRVMTSWILRLLPESHVLGGKSDIIAWPMMRAGKGSKVSNLESLFILYFRKPIGCVLFKQYLDHLKKYPGFFHACKCLHPYFYLFIETSKETPWAYGLFVSTGSKHYIGIFFLNTEDFALAYYKDKVKHPTYIMTMLMGM